MTSNGEPGEPIYGHAAFQALSQFLAAKSHSGDSLPELREPAFARVITALREPGSASCLDVAVLIRQALRYQCLNSLSGIAARLSVPIGDPFLTAAEWEAVGVEAMDLR